VIGSSSKSCANDDSSLASFYFVQRLSVFGFPFAPAVSISTQNLTPSRARRREYIYLKGLEEGSLAEETILMSNALCWVEINKGH